MLYQLNILSKDIKSCLSIFYQKSYILKIKNISPSGPGGQYLYNI